MAWSPTMPEGGLSSVAVALWHLRVALDDKGDPPNRSDAELTGLLETEKAVLVSYQAGTGVKLVANYYRPWEVAAQIIELNEYEVVGELTPVTNRKIAALRRRQSMIDLRYGFFGFTDENGNLLRAASEGDGGTGGVTVITWGDR